MKCDICGGPHTTMTHIARAEAAETALATAQSERDAAKRGLEIYVAKLDATQQQRDAALAQVEALKALKAQLAEALNAAFHLHDGELVRQLRQRITELEQALGWYAANWQGAFGDRARKALAATTPDAQP